MRRKYQFQQVSTTAGAGQQPPAIAPQTIQNPSPFLAATGVSGSIVLVGGVLSVAYSIDYTYILTIATLPWMVYGVGKSVYLVILLITDIAMLFEPSEPKQKSTLLPIAKED